MATARKLLPVSTPQGDITALVPAANPLHEDYVGQLSVEKTTAMIAGASGVNGTNRRYLKQLVVAQLANLAIYDPYMQVVEHQVRPIGGP